MKKKRPFLLCLLLCAALLLSACGDVVNESPSGSEDTPALPELSTFPATEADMELLLGEFELDWILEDSLLEEGNSAFLYHLPSQDVYLSFDMSLGEDGQRLFQLDLTDNKRSRLEALHSLESIAPQAFAIAEALFGQGNTAAKTFAELAESHPQEEWQHAYSWQNSAREGEFFYTLDLSCEEGLYELSRLEINNLAAYEDTQYFLITMRAAGRISVDEVPTEWDDDRGYSNVNGRLSNFRPATELWPEAPAHWKAATLSDGSASVEVLLLPKGFTEEEWSVERKHLLEFRGNLPYPLVSSSALLRPEDEIPEWKPQHSPQIDEATGAYIYPAYPGEESWDAFWAEIPKSTHPENAPLTIARQRMNIPEEILQEMSTDALVLTVLDYPLMSYSMDVNSPGEPKLMVDTLKRFNGAQELFRREDAREKLATQLELLEAEYEADSSYENLLRRNYIRGLLEELERRLEEAEAESAPEQP